MEDVWVKFTWDCSGFYVSTNHVWSTDSWTVVIDDAACYRLNNPTWDSCSGCGLILDTCPFNEQNWVFYKLGNYDGIPINSSCTSVRVEVQGELEQDDQQGGLWVFTDRSCSSLPSRLSIGTSCTTRSVTISNPSCWYGSAVGTRIYVEYRDTGGTWHDYESFVDHIKITFVGWKTPVLAEPIERFVPESEFEMGVKETAKNKQ